ncbi:MAG: NfeD family protein [Proteobacteria bacterium]|nr:NfeD family protein [Pseudomonadota bacterium]MDA1063196.1 NfeD family protein [Pseudomonadota bacterium]
MTWWSWMILGAVLLGAEMFAVDAQFYLVFLGVSAALVGLSALFGIAIPEWGQWLAFAVLSLLFFFTFRRTLYLKIRGGGENYPETMSGESVEITADLAPGAEARTQLHGSDWTVRNVGTQVINGGSRARVVHVNGLTLHVSAE